MASATSIALFSVCEVRHNKTIFDKAVGEIGRLVEIPAEMIVYSTEMFQPVNPFARTHVVVQDVGAPMQKQRSK